MARSRLKKTQNEDDFYDDIQELEQDLTIDEHALEEALQSQAEAFYRVSKALAMEISRRDGAKQHLQTVEAQADLLIRAKAEEKSIKISVAEVDAHKRLDHDVVLASLEYMRFNDQVNKLIALKEAFQMRSYALKDLCALYIANYYTATEHSTSQNIIKDRTADSARRAMREERKELAE